MDALPPPSMDLQECALLFKERVPTLEQITSFNIARCLLYNAIFSEGNIDEIENEINQKSTLVYKKRMYKSSQYLQDYINPLLIPRPIRSSMLDIWMKFTDWVYDITKTILPDHNIRIFRGHLECLVWRFDGKIDHTKTARKMLYSENLSQVDRFAIMCRYCLVDEFEKFTINEEFETALASVIKQRRPRLLFYWICKLKKDLREMQFGPNFESLESLMVTKMRHGHVEAIEYFWDRLSEQDQVVKAMLLLKKYPDVQFKKKLLSKMNEFQLGQILSEIPVEIISKFWDSHYIGEPELAFSIWTKIKHCISNEQFGDLLDEVIRFAGIRSNRSFPLIIKLWDTANDHQKMFILDKEKYNISQRLFSYDFFPASKMLQFLYAMMSYSSPNYRKQFILELGVEIMVGRHYFDVCSFPSLLIVHDNEDNYSGADRIIKLCLPSDNDVIEFKKQMMNSNEAINLCKKSFSWGYLENINKFVRFYAPDVSSMNNFKKLILDSSEFKTIHIFVPKYWAQVEKFVDDAYPDALLAKNMKRQLILTSGTSGLHDCMKIDALRSMINISGQFLSNEEIGNMKESLLNVFREKLMDWDVWESFDETDWQEFASFCFGDEEKINEFKSAISIDEVFGTKLRLMISQHDYIEDFCSKVIAAMDNFLKWYLVEHEEVKKYKLRRIFELNDLADIEALMSSPNKKIHIKPLLVWFLDNDEEQICKFKTEFSDKDVTQLI